MIAQGIKPSDITILTDVRMNNTPLSLTGGSIAGVELTDITAEEMTSGSIAVSTVFAYKGLEAPVVFYLAKTNTSDYKLNYVAYSRARCLLYVIQYPG